MAKRVKAFVRWRKRAKAAEAQVDALPCKGENCSEDRAIRSRGK